MSKPKPITAEDWVLATDSEIGRLKRRAHTKAKILRGFITTGTVAANGGFQNIAFSFPTGFFNSAPTVVGLPYSGRLQLAAPSVPTVSGATLQPNNWTASAVGSIRIDWIAIGS